MPGKAPLSPEEPLTPEEIAEVKLLFGSPFFIPAAYKAWMADQLALNIPDLPLGSLFGGRGITRSLEASTAASSVSANGTTGVIYSKVIQGGTLGANGHLRLMMDSRYLQDSVSQTWEMDLVFGGTVVATVLESSGGLRTEIVQAEIYNANSPSIQYAKLIKLRRSDFASPSSAAISVDSGSSAADTTVDQTLSLQVRFAGINANDHLDRSYVSLEIVNPVPLGATL